MVILRRKAPHCETWRFAQGRCQLGILQEIRDSKVFSFDPTHPSYYMHFRAQNDGSPEFFGILH